MRTEVAMRRWCRLASAEFCFCLLGACFAVGARAADNAPAVVPPKPVVVQPTAAMAPPPPVAPTATEAAPQPAAKGAKAGKKKKPAKPASKSKAKKR
jgi:hypothetical protein